MDEREVFLILGIQETNQEEDIRQAYLAKLQVTNPEDNPEGFKRLRQAYEEALILARKPREKGERDTSVAGLWIEKAEAIYGDISQRRDAENWKHLFEDPAFIDLDSCEEARRRFFLFSMEHYRYPTKVWKVLKQNLITGSREELYDFLPKNFVDYFYHQCEQGDWFPYDLLEGAQDGEYDLFIRHYFDISRILEEGQTEGVITLLDEADSLFISHPYMELERARFWQMEGKTEEALELFESTIKALGEDERAEYIGAKIHWACKDMEKARPYLEKLLVSSPDHYWANMCLSRYHLETKDYEKAKEYAIEAMKIANTDELQELLHEINEVVFKRYEQRIEEEPDQLKHRLEAGWCCLQEENYQRAIELVKPVAPTEDTMEEYHNLLGKIYYATEDYEIAREHISQWLSCLRTQNPTEEKAIRDHKSRLGTGYMMLGRIYRIKGKEDQSFFDQALEQVELALEFGSQKLGALIEKSNLFLEWEKLEECMDVCDQVLKEDPTYFPAYALKQEACSKLRDAHGVMQNYYEGIEVYGGYPKMYELAVEVLMDFGKYEDLEKLFATAEENEVSSTSLMISKGKFKRIQSEDREQALASCEYLESLLEKLKEGNASKGDQGSVICEIGLCHEIAGEAKKAIELMDRAAELDPENDRYLWIKANILRNSSRYTDALEVYRLYEKKNPGNDYDNLYYYMGECKRLMNQRDEAISLYKQTLRLNHEHKRANNRISEIYTEYIEESGRNTYFEEALPYANRQLELQEEAYYYIERGLLYLAACHYDKALEDFTKASELEPENIYALINAGCVFKYTGEYQKAIDILKKAVDIMEGDETTLAYGNLGDSYRRMGNHQEAISCFDKNTHLFPKYKETYRYMADTYRLMEEYEKALECFRNLHGENTNQFHKDVCEVYLEQGKWKDAIKSVKALAKKKGMSEAWLHYKQALAYQIGGVDLLAGYHFKRAYVEVDMQSELYKDICMAMCFYFHTRKKPDKAAYYGEEGTRSVNNKFLENIYSGRYHYYMIGMFFFFQNNNVKAKEYLDKMQASYRCRNCIFPGCVHGLMGQAAMKELEGEYAAAVALYEKALILNPNMGWICRPMIKYLKDRK